MYQPIVAKLNRFRKGSELNLHEINELIDLEIDLEMSAGLIVLLIQIDGIYTFLSVA